MATRKYTPTCIMCGAQFTANRRHARFCSPKCKMAHHRGKPPVTDPGKVTRPENVTSVTDSERVTPAENVTPVTDSEKVTEAERAYEKFVDDYYKHSKAKDPKGRLERAIEAVVQHEVLPKVREVFRGKYDEEIQKAREEIKERSRSLCEREEKAKEKFEQYLNLHTKVDGILTFEEFSFIRGILHPDRAPADRAADYNRAFHLFNQLSVAVNQDKRRAKKWKGNKV